MDIDGLSSPPAPLSSLPPSSAPFPSTNERGSPRSNPRSSPVARRQPADALAFGDDEAEEEQEGDESAVRRRRRARGQVNGDVPLVKDAVGESVAESFETFLKGSVHCLTRHIWPY
jgi:DNA replication licensing factor MCM6